MMQDDPDDASVFDIIKTNYISPLGGYYYNLPRSAIDSIQRGIPYGKAAATILFMQ